MHDKYSELLQLYLDSEIEPLEKILLEEHLSYCHTCRKELNHLKMLDWELKHSQEIEVPAELSVLRMKALKKYLLTRPDQEKGFEVKDVWRLQVNIFKNASGFISKNPVNRTINRTLKGPILLAGKLAGAGLKKRNPVLGRFISGQA